MTKTEEIGEQTHRTVNDTNKLERQHGQNKNANTNTTIDCTT